MTQCPLCEQSPATTSHALAEAPSPMEITICEACANNMTVPSEHSEYWQCLTTSMWNEEDAVKVTAYRLLRQLSGETWAQEALDMLYLEDETKAWAEAGVPTINSTPTRDSNGAVLNAGDTVTLIKDLPVKGAGFTAKRGTSVRGISLTDNPEHVEGKVNGQRIVLVAAFLKKS